MGLRDRRTYTVPFQDLALLSLLGSIISAGFYKKTVCKQSKCLGFIALHLVSFCGEALVDSVTCSTYYILIPSR